MIRSTQAAEEVLQAHEEQLKEVQAVPATLAELEATKAMLKVPLHCWTVFCRGVGQQGPKQTSVEPSLAHTEAPGFSRGAAAGVRRPSE